jgi:hypothetical protein
MSDRRVIIGPYQVGALSGLMQASNLVPVVPRLPLDRLVYTSLIQAGATRIQLASTRGDALAQVPTRWRGEEFDSKAYRAASERLDAAFGPHLPENYRRDRAYKGIWTIEAFLLDLLYAVRQKAAIASVVELPTRAECDASLPPVLAVPVGNLLSAFSATGADLPFPIASVDEEHIERFEHLLSSGIFADYADSHQELEEGTAPVSRLVKGVTKQGARLVRAAPDLVTLRRATINILPLAGKVVDVAFGKLAGILAGFAADTITKSVGGRRRVVIYQLDGLATQLVTQQLQRLMAFMKDDPQGFETAVMKASESLKPQQTNSASEGDFGDRQQ